MTSRRASSNHPRCSWQLGKPSKQHHTTYLKQSQHAELAFIDLPKLTFQNHGPGTERSSLRVCQSCKYQSLFQLPQHRTSQVLQMTQTLFFLDGRQHLKKWHFVLCASAECGQARQAGQSPQRLIMVTACVWNRGSCYLTLSHYLQDIRRRDVTDYVTSPISPICPRIIHVCSQDFLSPVWA